MRLFTGLSIPPPILQTLTAALDQLRPTAPLNWSPPDNLHITLKFIGAWPEPRLPELRQTLETIPRPGSIAIDIARFGFFPNPHRPHSFFAAVHAGPQIASLAAAIDEALVKIGCPPENRPYTPHLTLARIRVENIRGEDIGSLREQIAAMNNFQFGSFEATHFHLYASTPTQGVSVYSILASYPLGVSA